MAGESDETCPACRSPVGATDRECPSCGLALMDGLDLATSGDPESDTPRPSRIARGPSNKILMTLSMWFGGAILTLAYGYWPPGTPWRPSSRFSATLLGVCLGAAAGAMLTRGRQDRTVHDKVVREQPSWRMPLTARTSEQTARLPRSIQRVLPILNFIEWAILAGSATFALGLMLSGAGGRPPAIPLTRLVPGIALGYGLIGALTTRAHPGAVGRPRLLIALASVGVEIAVPAIALRVLADLSIKDSLIMSALVVGIVGAAAAVWTNFIDHPWSRPSMFALFRWISKLGD